MDLELAGKRALVTGATRGLGRAIAERLAAEGCALAMCARDGNEVERVAGELRAQGVAVHGAAVDVTDYPALERFVTNAGATLGGLDRRADRLESRHHFLPVVGHAHRIRRHEREPGAARERLSQAHPRVDAERLGCLRDLADELLAPGLGCQRGWPL